MAIKTSSKKLKIVSGAYTVIEDDSYYLAGDTITLECEDGYFQEGTDPKAENDHADIYGNYDDYGTRQVEEVAFTKTLRCDENGKWNNEIVANYGICREITCDASSYQHIRNGVITNYKDVYKFREMMTLKCNEGFRPNNNRDDMECLTDDSFKNQDFKCDEDYCQPPCVPFGARVVYPPRLIDLGTTIEFACNDKMYGGSTTRTCLFNKQWSDEPIDCSGWSLFTSDTGIYLKEALKNTVIKEINGGSSKTNTSGDADTVDIASGRSIGVTREFGVDAYILLDVSSSIVVGDFEKMKKFVIALVKNLAVSNATDGNRVTVSLFATNIINIINQHEPKEQSEDFIIEKVNKTTLHDVKTGTGYGTAISVALEDVRMTVQSKRNRSAEGLRQQVVILISDGKYTQRGNPTAVAADLKQIDVEIFCIAIGSKHDANAFRIMEEMASKKDNEHHFFAVDKDWDMTDTIDKMIEKTPDFSCGATNSIRTGTKNISQSNYVLSERHAWPWMVQFRAQETPVCGGTLISNSWVLTAAHCFNFSPKIDKVILKQWKTSTLEDGIIQDDVAESNVFKHEKYKNPGGNTNFTYDIALVKLRFNVQLSSELHTVCLWNNETANATGVSYESLFKPQKYGIVTGWGHKLGTKESEVSMKQMQFPIQNFNECIQNKKADATVHFDERFMFCAGTAKDEPIIIDACKGDSGGPFVVQHPGKENKYIQIGIVSFQTKDGCRLSTLDGYYTRLNEDLLEWIEFTMAQRS